MGNPPAAVCILFMFVRRFVHLFVHLLVHPFVLLLVHLFVLLFVLLCLLLFVLRLYSCLCSCLRITPGWPPRHVVLWGVAEGEE